MKEGSLSERNSWQMNKPDVILQKLNPHKAPGPDGPRGRVLKGRAAQLAPAGTKMFQLILDSNFYPQAWKTANIIPVPKTHVNPQ